MIGFIVLVAIVAGIWTDCLWFSSVHYTSVFGTTYGTRWAMFFIAGLFMALVTWGATRARLPAEAAVPAGAHAGQHQGAGDATGWPSTRTAGCCSACCSG